MYSYVTRELPGWWREIFRRIAERQGIFGHSMGGHGALVLRPSQPRAVQVGVRLCAHRGTHRSPWGRKAFSGYLGEDRSRWSAL